MNRQPLVSILMPVKNTELFLTECLNSIQAQSYQNWQLVAVDDYSMDASYKLLVAYSQKDKRIIVHRNAKHGIIAALRLAYSQSAGEFITRMDSDDIMKTTKIELMVEQLKLSGRGYLAVGLVKYFSENKIGEGYVNYEKWLNRLTLLKTNFKDIYKECSIPSPCWMVARNDFETCGGFNSEIYPEDYDLAFRFKKNGLKIAAIPEIIHQWRDYALRTSRTHPNYKDNRFTKLKVTHFLDQDYDTKKPLVLWGAGKKGKKIAELLIENQVQFQWISNNINKIGKNIYGVTIKNMYVLKQLINAQVIIALSSPSNLNEIKMIINSNTNQLHYKFY